VLPGEGQNACHLPQHLDEVGRQIRVFRVHAALLALRLGRRYLGIELSEETAELAPRRLAQETAEKGRNTLTRQGFEQEGDRSTGVVRTREINTPHALFSPAGSRHFSRNPRLFGINLG
jgi:hypothetical protein